MDKYKIKRIIGEILKVVKIKMGDIVSIPHLSFIIY
jgi:hypothetical protein